MDREHDSRTNKNVVQEMPHCSFRNSIQSCPKPRRRHVTDVHVPKQEFEAPECHFQVLYPWTLPVMVLGDQVKDEPRLSSWSIWSPCNTNLSYSALLIHQLPDTAKPSSDLRRNSLSHVAVRRNAVDNTVVRLEQVTLDAVYSPTVCHGDCACISRPRVYICFEGHLATPHRPSTFLVTRVCWLQYSTICDPWHIFRDGTTHLTLSLLFVGSTTQATYNANGIRQPSDAADGWGQPWATMGANML